MGIRILKFFVLLIISSAMALPIQASDKCGISKELSEIESYITCKSLKSAMGCGAIFGLATGRVISKSLLRSEFKEFYSNPRRAAEDLAAALHNKEGRKLRAEINSKPSRESLTKRRKEIHEMIKGEALKSFGGRMDDLYEDRMTKQFGENFRESKAFKENELKIKKAVYIDPKSGKIFQAYEALKKEYVKLDMKIKAMPELNANQRKIENLNRKAALRKTHYTNLSSSERKLKIKEAMKALKAVIREAQGKTSASKVSKEMKAQAKKFLVNSPDFKKVSEHILAQAKPGARKKLSKVKVGSTLGKAGTKLALATSGGVVGAGAFVLSELVLGSKTACGSHTENQANYEAAIGKCRPVYEVNENVVRFLSLDEDERSYELRNSKLCDYYKTLHKKLFSKSKPRKFACAGEGRAIVELPTEGSSSKEFRIVVNENGELDQLVTYDMPDGYRDYGSKREAFFNSKGELVQIKPENQKRISRLDDISVSKTDVNIAKSDMNLLKEVVAESIHCCKGDKAEQGCAKSLGASKFVKYPKLGPSQNR